MKAAFLIRCSTKKQDYERQVKDLIRLAKKFGYEYGADTIYGEHITGKDDASKKTRLSIQHLMEGAEEKKYGVVLVSEVSRMSRDPMSGELWVRQLTNKNIPIFFRDIDTWTIHPLTGKIEKNASEIIRGAFEAAKKYLMSMKTQIASGRRDELDNNCMSIGQPFFGYKRYGGKDKTTKNRWVRDDEAAKVVEDVYKEYLKDGATLKSTALSITAKYGEKFGKKFSIGTIEHILTFEPYYTGIKVVNLRDPDTEEVEMFEVEIPTIINKALFDDAAKKRSTNRTVSDPYPKQKKYVLSKLLKCPICGHSLTPRKKTDVNSGIRLQNGKPAVSWCCMSGITNATDCNSRITISNEKLEAIIWGLVKKELIGFANLNTEDRMAKIEEMEQKIANIDADIANFEAQIVKMDKDIKKAMELYMDAPNDDIREMMKEDYYRILTASKNEKADCDSKIKGLKDKKDLNERFLASLRQPTLPDDAISKAEADPIEMRRLVTELIEKIYPYRIATYVSPATHRVMKNGIVLLEVYAVDAIYYILYDGNQRNNKTAYYISSHFATFQNGKSKETVWDAGEYFVIQNASMVMDTEEIVEFANMNEIIGICEANGWEIDYTYK